MILSICLMNLLATTWFNGTAKINVFFGRLSIAYISLLIYSYLVDLFYVSDNLILFDGLLKLNSLTTGNTIYILLVVNAILLITRLNRADLFLILIISVIGLVSMISSNDLFVTLLSLQLINLSFYFLLSIEKKSLSAGFKYLLLSAFTTVIFLFGIVLIYGLLGTTNYEAILASSNYVDIKWPLFLILIALFFKLGLAPFHSWVPDVYEGSPTIVTLYLATVPKFTILALILNISYLLGPHINYIIIPAAIISTVVGCIGLGAQLKIKRFLAYSAISHMGFILFALATTKMVYSHESYIPFYSFIFYIAIYGLTTINLFSIVLGLSPNKDIGNLNSLAGLFHKNPAAAIALATCLLSLAGIPPLAGFYAKVWVLFALIQNNYLFIAIVAILTSIVSTAFYIKLVKIVFLDKSTNSLSSIATNNALVTSFSTFAIIFMFVKI